MKGTLAFLKSPYSLIGVVGFAALAALGAFWWPQQQNVNSLQESINKLENQIEALPPTISSKDKIGLEKDRLTLEQQRVSAQNAVYGSLIQALGGAFFFVTAGLSWRNVKATEEKQITERFSKSIEQLGSDKLKVRLGGIYGLERISIDSRKDCWTIMEVLTSFIQERAPLQQDKAKTKAKTYVESFINEQQKTRRQKTGKITTDVQAALTVIGRRDFNKDPKEKSIVLSFVNLVGANLVGANLRKANLRKANLREANLYGANLDGANLNGADFREANLLGANLVRADLFGADLREANLVVANLLGANLYGANLNGAYLFKANLDGAYLNEAYLDGANLDGAYLKGADLREANLKGADLSRANLSGVINLTKEQISVAITDENTKLPDHLQKLNSQQPETS